MAFEDYDVKLAFARIENELIASMMRNLKRHLKEEEEEGFDWSQWQVEQLKYLQEYRRRNQKEYGPRFSSINAKMEEAIRFAHENGQKDEELNILDAISKDKRIRPRYQNPSQASIEGAGDAFFRVNDRKLEALVEATHSDLEKAEQAVLRRTNDQYRKIIFDAQMYANTGAGTIEKAVDMATKDFLAKGIDSIQYKNGARHTISDYADMYIRTAERRAYLMGEGKKRQEWGESLVIVNRRGTMTNGNYGHACPQCIPWLGKILIDDVYSGGKPDGKHQLLSEAMAAGFLHPRCKDSFTTYIPGISPQEDPVTKQEAKKAVEAEKAENQLQYAERQQEKYERLAEYSLDPENKRKYEARQNEWQSEADKIEQKKIDEAFKYYVSGDGMFVNNYLAGRYEEMGAVWTEADQEYLELLDKGTQENVKQKKLWRSVDASAVFGDLSASEYDDIRNYLIYGESSVPKSKASVIRRRLEAVTGKTIPEPRFMSTTTDKELAMEWGDFSGSDKPIVLEFDVPDGIKGADLKRFDMPDDPQNEVLLHRGQNYRVKAIGVEDGQIVVKAELVPEEVLDREYLEILDSKIKTLPSDEVSKLRNNIPHGYVDKRVIGAPISKERLQAFLDKAAEKGIRIGADPGSTGNFELYCGDPDLLDDILDHIDANMQMAKKAGLMKPDDDIILVYDNVLGFKGDRSAIDIGAFAETRGRTITLNTFMFDSTSHLMSEYKDAVKHGDFAKGTSFKNIVDHEFGHIIDKRNRWLKKRLIDVLNKRAVNDKISIEKYIIDHISTYASARVKKEPFTELVAEIVSMKSGDNREFAEELLREAGVNL